MPAVAPPREQGQRTQHGCDRKGRQPGYRNLVAELDEHERSVRQARHSGAWKMSRSADRLGRLEELLHAQGGPHLDTRMRNTVAVVAEPVRLPRGNNHGLTGIRQDRPPTEAEAQPSADHREGLFLLRMRM